MNKNMALQLTLVLILGLVYFLGGNAYFDLWLLMVPLGILLFQITTKLLGYWQASPDINATLTVCEIIRTNEVKDEDLKKNIDWYTSIGRDIVWLMEKMLKRKDARKHLNCILALESLGRLYKRYSLLTGKSNYCP